MRCLVLTKFWVYQGMAGSSSWLCFEAVDKLSTELMYPCAPNLCHAMIPTTDIESACSRSVISLCILAVQQAVRCKSDTLTINGDTIQLGIATNALQGAPPCSFVTFKSQYGERAVPDSLRVLFRPVLILTHDIEHIIETNLIANGFEQAQALARYLSAFASTMPRPIVLRARLLLTCCAIPGAETVDGATTWHAMC